MDQFSFGSKRHNNNEDEPDFNLKEWGLKARENTNSRRFSASNLNSFRDDAKSNINISSTASSPGYTIKGEIDPSTYSFTTALKALQAKRWEYERGDGKSLKLLLHSKWNEAEKYISNPLSGEVPLECLSAKTQSFRSRIITMSAPLIYQPTFIHHQLSIQEEKKRMTRDVGIQSTPVDLGSRSPSPTRTPSIEERSIKHSESTEETEESLASNEKFHNPEIEVEEVKEKKEYTNRNEKKKLRKNSPGSGCLLALWTRPRHNKHKPINISLPSS